MRDFIFFPGFSVEKMCLYVDIRDLAGIGCIQRRFYTKSYNFYYQ